MSTRQTNKGGCFFMGKFISMQRKTANKAVDEAFAEFIQYGTAENMSVEDDWLL